MTRASVEAVVTALENAQVRYLIAGGLAVVAHGHVRFTADVDLLLDPDTENLQRAIAALSRLHYGPRAPVAFAEFADADARRRWHEDKGMLVFSLRSALHPATELDLFLEPPVDFAVAWSRAALMELAPGVRARFVALADLRAMKRAAGREQDRLDLEALERLHPEAGE